MAPRARLQLLAAFGLALLGLAGSSAADQACGFAFADLDVLDLPPPLPETRLIARDLDGDGRDEILVSYPSCPGSLWIVGSDGSSLSVLQVLGPADGLEAAPSGIDAADLDLDGDVDLVVGHLDVGSCLPERGLTVLHRRADGSYGDADVYPGDNDGRHVLAVDLQGTGWPALVAGDGPLDLNPTTGKAVQVRENEGPGDFEHVHEYGLQPAVGAAVPGLLAAGMLDGHPTGDVLVYWPDRNATGGLCNFGDSTFELLAETYVSPRPAGASTGSAAGDLNDDGLIDLVIAYGDSGEIGIHQTTPAAAERDCWVAGQGGILCSSAAGVTELLLVDFDEDGAIDILGLVPAAHELAFHGGDGIAFGAVQRRDHDGMPARVASGRLAGDVRPDLAVLDVDGRLHLLENRTIDEGCPIAVAAPQPVAVADASCNGPVVLDGSHSTDPEGLPLTYLWFLDGSLALETTAPIAELPAVIGNHVFMLVVRDAAGNESRPASVTLRVRDGIPPTVDADPPLPAECEGPDGASVMLTASADDECTSVTLTASRSDAKPLGSPYPIGHTGVDWRARDAGGNLTIEAVLVSVVDTVPPVLSCPTSIVVDCLGAGMAEVELSASVEDLCTGPCDLSVENDRTGGGTDASGLYPFGETRVRFDAEDPWGNASSCETLVSVVDSTPPLLALPPGPLMLECTGEDGAFAVLEATASDSCSGAVVDNDRSGGSSASGLYPFGPTVVAWTASDGAGNEVPGQSLVVVVDTTPPALACPPPILRECSSAGGTPVELRAQAVDRCDPAPVGSNDRTAGGLDASGDYPLGATEVRFTAQDSAGNAESCLALVEVRDTTPPELQCPAEIRVPCAGAGEAFVALQARASDCCDPSPAVSNDRTAGGADASGSYPLGTTLVHFDAEDAAGLAATCETRVVVEDLEPPVLGCPAEVHAECADPAGTFVAVQALAFDRCDPAPVVSNDRSAGGSDASGLYPSGATPVHFEAVDATGALASCDTLVVVEDTRAPLLSCPSLLEAECLGPSGTRVGLQAFAADGCDPAPLLSNDRTAGGGDATDLYPLGDTLVRFTAVDAEGHAASCDSIVRVADTLPPQVLLDTDDRCLWPPNHRFVRFRLGEELRVVSSDLCAEDGELELEILEVLSNEEEDGRGDGSTEPDFVVTGDELLLRSERSGGAPGRIYTVRVLVTDPSGNASVGEIEIRVPHGGNAPEGCKALPPSRFVR